MARIAGGSFSGHPELRCVRVPDTVETILSLAFTECKNVHIRYSRRTTVCRKAFFGCPRTIVKTAYANESQHGAPELGSEQHRTVQKGRERDVIF